MHHLLLHQEVPVLGLSVARVSVLAWRRTNPTFLMKLCDLFNMQGTSGKFVVNVSASSK